MNRVIYAEKAMKGRMKDDSVSLLESLGRAAQLTSEEHFDFQSEQARAHASGLLDLDEANAVYRALGPQFSYSNGGWAKETTIFMKIVVHALMAELFGARIGANPFGPRMGDGTG